MQPKEYYLDQKRYDQRDEGRDEETDEVTVERIGRTQRI
jgi:hypothetical protein